MGKASCFYGASAEFMLRISKYFNMMVEDVFHVED